MKKKNNNNNNNNNNNSCVYVMQFNATVGYGTVSDSGAADFDGFVAGSGADGEYVSSELSSYL